jgi:hypothetical protein
MLISTAMLSEVILAERRLDEMPARQERRRLARLAAEVARCCRVSFGGRLIAALDRLAIAARGAIR